MGTPPPTRNLDLPRPPYTITETNIGKVVEIVGTNANVSVGGSVFTVRIPGSVLGVKVGKSVAVRSDGNSRTITAVTSPLTKPTYTGSPSSIERGPTTAPPSQAFISINEASLTGVALLGDCSNASSVTLSELNRAFQRLREVNNRYSNPIHNNFGEVLTELISLKSAIETIASKLNLTISSVGSVRNKADTTAADLRDTTGVFE